MRPLLSFLLLAAFLPGTGCQEDSVPARWDEDVVHLAATLPVQDQGRVKPLDTYASVKLLGYRGNRSVKTPAGEKLGPVEWLLDCLFFPELAAEYDVFTVNSSETLDALQVPHEGRSRRARYSYAKLYPVKERLYSLARQYVHIEPADRTAVQGQIVALAENLFDFENLMHYLDFARVALPVNGAKSLEELFPSEEPRFTEVLRRMPQLYDVGQDIMEKDPSGPESRALGSLLNHVDVLGASAESMALFPPEDASEKEWSTPAHVVDHARATGGPPPEAHLAYLTALEDLAHFAGSPQEFRGVLAGFHAAVTDRAAELGQYDRIELEVFFHRGDFLFRSLFVFVFAFLLAAVGWLAPRSRILRGGLWALTAGGLALLVFGITLRCIIRGRPPVTTLYETILFITAVGVLVGMIIEGINRKRVGLNVAALIGALGMALAIRYEITDASDTMPNLVAVLDTNFWLSTHVTTVVTGYGAGLLAAAIAHVYLLGKLFRWKKDNPVFYRDVARMVYGVLCFGLFFSVVGTILGGIWANDSWGRFWGWDPKENGALLIVLWELILLHARMGGYIRDHGLCMGAVFGANVVTFSWWGVNLLGEGLHSYGFTEGLQRTLHLFYGLEYGVLGLGMLAWMWSRGAPPKPAAPAPRAEVKREVPTGAAR